MSVRNGGLGWVGRALRDGGLLLDLLLCCNIFQRYLCQTDESCFQVSKVKTVCGPIAFRTEDRWEMDADLFLS